VTELLPTDLLKLLKYIETTVGRVPSIRNGPRAIDLDVLTYDRLVMDTRSKEDQNGLDNLTGHLLVPHPRMLEREFVLRPLAEYVHIICGAELPGLIRLLASCQNGYIPSPSEASVASSTY
jgi:dihydroneopterin aldolase/2-amino-4-hydroxy-6-hydroxymethyldihydropteridine diphosphokinase/dihydropteroate synthase